MKSKRINISEYRYHHTGIPSKKVGLNERYSKNFGMYTSDHDGDFRIQYHRFEKDSPIHPLIINNPHIAFQVDDLENEIQGREVILGPYEPIPNYKVAVINDNGLPIELIETTLTIEELWDVSHKQDDLNVEGLEL